MTGRDRLAIHTITNKPWSLRECVAAYAAAGVPGISVWRESFADLGASNAKKMIDAAGVRASALVRGGFFCSADAAERRARIDDNEVCLEDAATIGAEVVVLVPGAVSGTSLDSQRNWVREGIEAILPRAESTGVRLALEPLHPMYAADRSCVVTLSQANDLCECIAHPLLGVVVDVYHTWWDDRLESEIQRAGDNDRLFAFHINDWRSPTRNLLTDRAMMGDGCIPIRRIREWMDLAGFSGFIEVEILSEELWSQDQGEVLARILHAYEAHC